MLDHVPYEAYSSSPQYHRYHQLATSTSLSAELAFGIETPKDHLPLTILLDESDGTLVWLRGMRGDMGAHLQRVLEQR